LLKRILINNTDRFITDNDQLANKFRGTLQKLKATDLENIVFENSKDAKFRM